MHTSRGFVEGKKRNERGRRALRYQMGNQNPEIEGQTTQWPKVKWQKDKQWSTKHYKEK